MKSREEPERIGTGTPEDWKTMSIDQVKARKSHALAMGPFGSNITTDNFVSSGVPVIRGNNLTGFRFNDSGFVFITEDKADELASSNAFPGDIVVTHRGTIGQVGIIPANSKFPRYVVSQSQMKLTCDTLIANPDFVFYFLKSPQGQYLLLRNVSTTGVPAIAQPLTSLRNIQIGLPDLDEQKRITNILTSFDSKIELAIQTNTTMESFEQALFRHWFVDFEYPNEEGQPYKSSGGKMLDSELGLIPEDWQVRRLGDFIWLEKGLSYKGRYLSGEGIPMVNLGTMAPRFGFLHRGLKHYTGEFKDRNLVRVGDIVVANTDITQKRDVLGSPAIVPPDLGSERVLFTHHIYAIRNESQLTNTYVYQLLKLDQYRDRARGYATGTTVLALPKDAILDFEFACPPLELVRKYSKTLEPFLLRIDYNNIESRSLTSVRDALLPKLLTGEIRPRSNN